MPPPPQPPSAPSWFATHDPMPLMEEADVVLARAAAQSQPDLPAELRERAALVISELAWNAVRHAGRGWLSAHPLRRGSRVGFEIRVCDRGPGLYGIRQALRGRVSEPGGLGVGLAAVRRHAQELDVDVRYREGTAVVARCWSGPGIGRRELAVLGRPIPSERRSGDHAAWRRRGQQLDLLLVDGTGHGEAAREAADRAVRAWASRAGPPARLIPALDEALRGSRGAAVAALSVDEATGQLSFAGIGNIHGRVASPRGGQRLVSRDGIAGQSSRRRGPAPMDLALQPGDTVVLCTDGLRSSQPLQPEALVPGEHPSYLAETLLRQWGKDHDDATVVVLR